MVEKDERKKYPFYIFSERVIETPQTVTSHKTQNL